MWRMRKEIIYPVSFFRFLAAIKFNNEWYDTRGDGTRSDSYVHRFGKEKKDKKNYYVLGNSSFLAFFLSRFLPKTQQQHTILCFLLKKYGIRLMNFNLASIAHSSRYFI